MGVEEWIGCLPPGGTDAGHAVTNDLPTVTRTDDAAVATVEVQFDGRHVFTGYVGVYRFPEGWRIVNEIFQAH